MGDRVGMNCTLNLLAVDCRWLMCYVKGHDMTHNTHICVPIWADDLVTLTG